MSPYKNLPPEKFWKTGVEQQHPLRIAGIYKKKFPITAKMRVAAAGSCFAQHVARNLRARGYNVMNLEPAPPYLSASKAAEFGYNLYSARYGNIYLTRQLLQLTKEAMGLFTPADAIWKKGERYFDALRPSVEPEGLESEDEVRAHRAIHLERVLTMLRTMHLLVFTFGLTEGWVHKDSGTVYPTAPGTIAGTFDPDVYVFKNFDYSEILADFLEFKALVAKINPGAKFLLTVSPVPLTATASEDHVLSATIYSKSVLRAVVGVLAKTHDDIDYFPSYELVASHFSRGMFYASNLREVDSAGVSSVMRVFFGEHTLDTPKPVKNGDQDKKKKSAPPAKKREEDVVCEDALLEAFATGEAS